MSTKNFRGRSMLDMVLGKSNEVTEPPSASNVKVTELPSASNVQVTELPSALNVEVFPVNETESFSLLCDETFPSSLMDLTFTDITLGLDESVKSLASIENTQQTEDNLNYNMIAIASNSKNSLNQEPQYNNLNHDTIETESSLQNVGYIEPEIDVEHADPTNGKTKSGKPRIRRKFEKSVETRLEDAKYHLCLFFSNRQ